MDHFPCFPSGRIRNVALVGHTGVGKTTVAEALLAHTGAVTRMGRVEDGTTVCDHEPEEISHCLTVGLSLAPCIVPNGASGAVKVNVIDTPGYADFMGEVAAAMSVVDAVVVVVSAVDGVEVQTEAVWRMAEQARLPRIIVVNKLDRDRADFDRVLADLRDRFGAGVAPLELPIGSESAFRGVVDLLADVAITYRAATSSGGQGAPASFTGETGDIPEDLAATEHSVHEALVEGIVVGDDALTERYLDGDVLSFEELEAHLADGVAAASVFPVVCTSATTGIGIDRLATLLVELCQAPTARPPARIAAGDTTRDVSCDSAGPPLARVFKTIIDPYVGRLSLCRSLSGTLRPDLVLVNPRTHADERLHLIEALRGRETLPVTQVDAGDLFAVAKLGDTRTGDTLAPKGSPVLVVSPVAPETEPPSLAIAIRPRAKGDEDKLMSSLQRLIDEDGTLSVRRDDETHQTILTGVGEMHLTIVLQRLHRKFGVDVERVEVLIPYRETISRSSTAEGRYKKQTGGHGQFGVATIRIDPLPRGEGFSFVDEVVGGAIPRQYIPAVAKGVAEAMAQGGAFGYPVVDVAVTCLDGKHHPVDSSELSFTMAGSLGFRDALAQASPVLLEPISSVVVSIPASVQGDVIGDLNARRGRVQGTEMDADGNQVVHALVPAAELTRYAVDVRSMTGGRGRFRAVHHHYDIAPSHVADHVAATRDLSRSQGVHSA